MTDMHREAVLLQQLKRLMDMWQKPTRATRDTVHCAEMLEEVIDDWQTAMRYRDEQEQTSVWRCYKEYMSGDGGRVHSEKFAKTKADMLIFKSQGYDCEKLSDEQEKQA